MLKTDYLQLKKPELIDLAAIGDINDNMDIIDNKVMEVEAEAKNKNGGDAKTVGGKSAEELQNYNNLTNKPTSLPADGGNADTVGGKSAEDFTEYFEIGSFEELVTSVKSGIFIVKDRLTSGISFYIGSENIPDATIYKYQRIYNRDGNLYSRIDYNNSKNGWSSGSEILLDGNIDFSRLPIGNTNKTVALGSHTHKKADISDFPESLPANGGNADTVGNKSADEFALADHTHDEYLEKNATISISQGGTGATTASSARSNLGLGTSATKGYTIAVTSGSTSLVTSGAVYKELQNYLKSDSASQFQPAMFQYINDLLNVSERTIYFCDGYTGKTPFSYGLTDAAVGICISGYFNDGTTSYITLVYIPVGDSQVFTTRFNNGATELSWKKINDGGNAQTVNKATKTFTVQTGSWFRFAKCKNALASGVFVLAVNSNNGHSSTSTISVSQAYSLVNTSQSKITRLSHSSFNTCVTKVRLDTKYGNNVEQYIDFYLEGGSDDTTGNVTVQFFGQGWEICDIESNNVITDYTTQEITL